uniref:VRK serine/threonine kinase 2 n=1 Tax=Oncorhynchus mykiss TaxID=8022 RepID=A0A8C7TTL9_ONCMY
SELKFHLRETKPENMLMLKGSKKLDFLGIPANWGSGLAEHNRTRYRFMAMDRLGSDLSKVCERNGDKLKKHTVLQLGCVLLDVLEYIHDNEYVHADVKKLSTHTVCLLSVVHVYLADNGLSYRYSPDGVHKENKENPKKGHKGTVEYTSIDAQNGVETPSRCGNLEVLGFCLLHWLCWALPWEAKTSILLIFLFLSPLPRSLSDELTRFMLHVKVMGYKQRPDYQKLRKLLSEGGQRASSGQRRMDRSGIRGYVSQSFSTRGSDGPATGKVRESERLPKHLH